PEVEWVANRPGPLGGAYVAPHCDHFSSELGDGASYARLKQTQHPTRTEQACDLVPADRRIDPVERSRGEHSVVGALRQLDVLEATQVVLDAGSHPAPGALDQLRACVHGVDDEAALGERAGQLTGAAADLEHARAGRQPSAMARSVDESIGVGLAE